MAFPLQLMFCTGVSRGSRPVAKVKKKLCFIGTEEFQWKLCRNRHPCDLAPSVSFTFLWQRWEVWTSGRSRRLLRCAPPDLSPRWSLWLTQMCFAPEGSLVCGGAEIPTPLPPPNFHRQPHPHPCLFSILNERGLLCFLCSLFHVTAAEWLLKMRVDEECEEGSFCFWSEPDGEWWKPHGLWRSPVRLSVYRAP